VFCQYCGKSVDDGARFCTGCGKQQASAPALTGPEVAARKMASHVKILGILWIVYSIFRVLTGIWTLAFSKYMLPMMSNILQTGQNPLPFSLVDMMRGVYAFSFAYSVVMGAVGLVAAWALLQRATWGRVAAIVIAIISVLSVPFGTAIAIYTLVILLSSDAEQNYRRVVIPA